jgi:hypothetical protein
MIDRFETGDSDEFPADRRSEFIVLIDKKKRRRSRRRHLSGNISGGRSRVGTCHESRREVDLDRLSNSMEFRLAARLFLSARGDGERSHRANVITDVKADRVARTKRFPEYRETVCGIHERSHVIAADS